MKIRYVTLLITILFVGTAICSAQNAGSSSVDFTGRWVSESVKSYNSDGLLPVPPFKDRLYLVVTHTKDEVRIKELSTAMEDTFRQATYYLDGRGETNKGYFERPTVESKTQLSDRKLKIDGTFESVQNRTVRSLQEWELSSDGNKLTITVTNITGGEVQNVAIYRRES